MTFSKDQFLNKVLNESYIPIIGNDLFKIIIDKKISTQDEIIDGNILTNIDDFLFNKLREQYNIEDNNCDLFKLIHRLQAANNLETIKSSVQDILNSLESNRVYIDHIVKLIEIQKFPILFNASVSNILSKISANYYTNYIAQLNFSLPPNSLLSFNREQYSPILVNMFGKANYANFAFGENEMLDYLFLFNNQDELSDILSDLMYNKHLLLIGLTIPSWILKVFIKLILKYRRDRKQEIIIITRDIYYDSQIKDYLNIYGVKYYPISALGFPSMISFISDFTNQIKSLDTRINIKYKESIFISYARKDVEFVNKFKEIIKSKGISVWYDIESLQSGDYFREVIQEEIQEKCKYFIPIISQNSIKNRDSYVYHYEWMTAVVKRRLNEKNSKKSFIKPILIDGTEFHDKKIPIEFRELQIDKIECIEDIDTFINKFIEYNDLTLI